MPETTLQKWSQTWNSRGTTFTSLLLEITDTASAAGSLLMDLKVDGSSKVKATKNGAVHVTDLNVADGDVIVGSSGITIQSQGASIALNDSTVTNLQVQATTLSFVGSITANRVIASPNGSSGAPTFRALVVEDIPTSARTWVISRSVGTVSASATFRLPPMPGFSGKVTAARLVVGAGVSASDSNYWRFVLKNRGTDGNGDTSILATGSGNTTKASGGIDGGAGLTTNAVSSLSLHATAGNRDVAAGDILVFEPTVEAGSPTSLVDAVLELDVEATA